MFVLPAMMLKGLHWGYTRFYINSKFFKPVNYTDDDLVRRYDKEGYVPVVPLSAQKEEQEEKDEDKESGGISACPVAPVLWLFGLHNAKKPKNHEKLSKEEILKEISEQKTAALKQ